MVEENRGSGVNTTTVASRLWTNHLQCISGSITLTNEIPTAISVFKFRVEKKLDGINESVIKINQKWQIHDGCHTVAGGNKQFVSQFVENMSKKR